MFLDETATTTQKYHGHPKPAIGCDKLHVEAKNQVALTASKPCSSSGKTRKTASSWPGLPLNITALCVSRAPSIRMDDLATTFFMGVYIHNSRFDYVPVMYRSCLGDESSALVASVSACALASLSLELECSEIAGMARKYYARALNLTNQALAQPDVAVRDDTLAAVLALSLFETITQDNELSQASWEAHVHGAALLLRMRGQRQFNSSLGRTLYLHAADSIRISCFQNKLPLPSHLTTLDEFAALKTESIIVALQNLVDKLMVLRASIYCECDQSEYESLAISESSSDEGSQSNATGSASLIARYRHFEEYVQAMSRQHASLLPYTQHCAPPSSEIFEGEYHVYRDRSALRVSNTLQMMLIWLNEQIWNLTSAPYFAQEGYVADERTRATRRGQQAARKLCATVPQLMGDIPSPVDGLASRLVLIWPLSMVGESTFLPAPLRDYAIAQLHRIGQCHKIPQATNAAEALEGKQTKRSW